MATLERAIALSARAHEGQIDKAGAPYIFHPLPMMLSVDSPEARMAADTCAALTSLLHGASSRQAGSAIATRYGGSGAPGHTADGRSVWPPQDAV